jgi:hypothetical protein
VENNNASNNTNHLPTPQEFVVGGIPVTILKQESEVENNPSALLKSSFTIRVDTVCPKTNGQVLRYLTNEGILDAVTDLGLTHPPKPFWERDAIAILEGKEEPYGKDILELGTQNKKDQRKTIVTYEDGSKEVFSHDFILVGQNQQERTALIKYKGKTICLQKVKTISES